MPCQALVKFHDDVYGERIGIQPVDQGMGQTVNLSVGSQLQPVVHRAALGGGYPIRERPLPRIEHENLRAAFFTTERPEKPPVRNGNECVEDLHRRVRRTLPDFLFFFVVEEEKHRLVHPGLRPAPCADGRADGDQCFRLQMRQGITACVPHNPIERLFLLCFRVVV